MIAYRVTPRCYELPPWIESFYVSIPFPHEVDRASEVVDKARADWDVGRYRVIGKAEARWSLVVVPVAYAWAARLEWWWRRHANWKGMELLLELGMFRLPYEGAFYSEAYFDPPGLYGGRIRTWETWLRPELARARRLAGPEVLE